MALCDISLRFPSLHCSSIWHEYTALISFAHVPCTMPRCFAHLLHLSLQSYHTFYCSVQLGGIFLLLFFQPFQALLHGSDVFRKFIGGIFLGICQRHRSRFFQNAILPNPLSVPQFLRPAPGVGIHGQQRAPFLGKQAAALPSSYLGCPLPADCTV